MLARLRHRWQRLGRPQRWALLVGLAVTLIRLSLVGKGTMAFIDERRYITAMLGLRELCAGHGLAFLQAIHSMGARPGDGLWRVIPGLGQAALLLGFGLNPNAPPSLQVPQAFNVLVISLNALLLYKIYRRFLGVGLALLGVALYSSLVNTNVYLRHLLPYDHALFFFLWALWLLLVTPQNGRLRRYVLVGVLASISYAVYPGYFMGPALLLMVGATRPFGQQARPAQPRHLGAVFGQLLGLLGVLAFLELTARAAGTSYFASSRYIAGTILQGSFAEGFSFIGQYYWEVEKWLGAGLLLLFGAGLLMCGRVLPAFFSSADRTSAASIEVRTLVVGAFATWLGYACLVALGHQLVFYGRILHFFAPFVVLGALVALQATAARPLLARCMVGVGLGVAAVSFADFVRAYRQVDYPCDFVYRHGILDVRQIAAIQTNACEQNVLTYRLFGPAIRNQPTRPTPRYRLVNFAYLYPLTCYRPVALHTGRVVAATPYFMKYTPYQFEGHSKAEREMVRQYVIDFVIVGR
ncbi:glycosyltransferase family 39 protein [Hymenobacter properus]|uniref:Glycosyltransferase family 39 protein n=1 Tax=Hymenobacter properus TaxID=2791026 RepID=A0A931BGD7_9BACT|nr:glycosyltransferase family 39 protein [Hymenobacter properus]MBF9143454.1 glycosyltransferase family 39 protein [Hymenobacter properus]MBR7722267.1 glycosyltransferase family 39 protein [Microvirga sp. SRT04]